MPFRIDAYPKYRLVLSTNGVAKYIGSCEPIT